MTKPLSALDVLSLSPVMPVVVLEDAALAGPLARALLAGGLKTLEIALRTPASLDAIRVAVAEAPDLVVGAGTVLNETDLDAAIAAGARYALSPGATPALLQAASRAPIPLVPGVATASEIMRRPELGYTLLQVFPCGATGRRRGAQAARRAFGERALLPHWRHRPRRRLRLSRARKCAVRWRLVGRASGQDQSAGLGRDRSVRASSGSRVR